MRIMVINDPHVAWTPPLGRKDDYFETICDKLRFCAQTAREKSVDEVVITGDLFHHKRTTQIPYAMVNVLCEVLGEFPNPPSVVPGNHDMGPEGMRGIVTRPLQTLCEMGVIQIPVLRHDIDIGCRMRDSVLSIFVPYNTERETDPTYYSPFQHNIDAIDTNLVAGAKVIIVFAHGPVLPVGEQRPYPYLTVDQIPYWQDVDYWFFGHIHEDLGIHRYRGTTYVNLGSLARVSRTQDNMTRKIKVALLDTEERIVKEIPVPHQAAREVFIEEESGETSEIGEELEQFARSLAEGLSGEQVALDALISGLDVNSEVKETVIRLLQEAGL